MPLELPSSLSPSKVSSFTECALAFRFSAIDGLPDPPTVATVRGTLVHAALERLMLRDPADRDLAAALESLDEAVWAMADDEEYQQLALDGAAEATFLAEAEQLVRRYLELEDPSTVTPIGLELRMELELDGLRLRGIIDRLELDADGELVVTDYKTGRAPVGELRAAAPRRASTSTPSCASASSGSGPPGSSCSTWPTPSSSPPRRREQSIRGLERKVKAIWSAIERACERDDFRPKQSRLCDYCAYQRFCPAFGGDPDEARALAVELRAGAERATAALTDGAAVLAPLPSPG